MKPLWPEFPQNPDGEELFPLEREELPPDEKVAAVARIMEATGAGTIMAGALLRQHGSSLGAIQAALVMEG